MCLPKEKMTNEADTCEKYVLPKIYAAKSFPDACFLSGLFRYCADTVCTIFAHNLEMRHTM